MITYLKIDRCYLEITNVCNLDCIFCPKTDRKKHTLTVDEYESLTNRLVGHIRFLYFHLMGEPMLHRHLPEFVRKARDKSFVPVLTTNGTLLASDCAEDLIESGLHKIQISLHSQEGNGVTNLDDYVAEVMGFSQRIAEKGTIVVLRLWNKGGHDKENDRLLSLIAKHIPQPWTERYDGWKLSNRIYIEYDNVFEWPDEDHEVYDEDEVFCYALRNQIGVLVDGTVVPCCLDHDGNIPLGNLHSQSLDEILSSPRAVAMYNGFTHHKATESLCQRCGYAAVAKRFRK